MILTDHFSATYNYKPLQTNTYPYRAPQTNTGHYKTLQTNIDSYKLLQTTKGHYQKPPLFATHYSQTSRVALAGGPTHTTGGPLHYGRATTLRVGHLYITVVATTLQWWSPHYRPLPHTGSPFIPCWRSLHSSGLGLRGPYRLCHLVAHSGLRFRSPSMV